MSRIDSLIGTKSESFYHKAIKKLIYKFVSERTNNIAESSLEKRFKNRRADIYFKLKTGQEVVVEIQHSKITVKELIKRTVEYNILNIYVLWILDGKGKCIASPKIPKDQKQLKISSVESFLHKTYGGRVYYANLNFYENRTTITPPFALHFSLTDKFSNKRFKKNFEYYYIRDAHVSNIPNWNLLCTTFLGFKIARFYDKNIKVVLNDKLKQFLHEKTRKSCENCRISFQKFRKCSQNFKCSFKPLKNKKLNKVIMTKFGKHYGNNFINSIMKEIMC